jgi:hypothetical protein
MRTLLVPPLFLIFAAAVYSQDAAGVIGGTVRDSVARIPLAGVRVSLANGTRAVDSVTGTTGGFRFSNLAPGDYTVNVELPHYGGGSQPVRLDADHTTAHLVLNLTPLADIAGVVLDEDGRPLPGIEIYTRRDGGTPVLESTSGRAGRYRIADLMPGNYQILWRVPLKIRSQTVLHDSSTGEQRGYRPFQYHPGVEDQHLATSTAVTADSRSLRIDLHLARSPLVDFSGSVVDADSGEPLPDALVALDPDSRIGDESFEPRTVNEQGGFRFELIAPGDYWMAVYREGRDSLPYYVRVTADESGRTAEALPIPSEEDIPVVVRIPHPEFRWEGAFTVNVRPSVTGANHLLTKFAESTSVLPGIPPGEWRFEVSAKKLHQLSDPPARLYIASMRVGNQNASGAPVVVAEGGNPPLEITLTDRTGGISGEVWDDGGQVSRPVAVFWVAADPGNGTAADAVSTDDEGYFELEDLPPGEYRLVAFPQDDFPPDPASVDCGDRETRTTLTGGGTATVRLRLCTR